MFEANNKDYNLHGQCCGIFVVDFVIFLVVILEMLAYVT